MKTNNKLIIFGLILFVSLTAVSATDIINDDSNAVAVETPQVDQTNNMEYVQESVQETDNNDDTTSATVTNSNYNQVMSSLSSYDTITFDDTFTGKTMNINSPITITATSTFDDTVSGSIALIVIEGAGGLQPSDSFVWDDADFTSENNVQNKVGEWNTLVIDATSGKFTDNGGSWIQCNTGTIVYVPVVADATIVVSAYDTGYSITGGEATALTDNGDKTYTYNFVYETDAVEVEGYDGKFAKLTMGSNGYWGDISLEY